MVTARVRDRTSDAQSCVLVEEIVTDNKRWTAPALLMT
jgi:hypothetical protein